LLAVSLIQLGCVVFANFYDRYSAGAAVFFTANIFVLIGAILSGVLGHHRLALSLAIPVVVAVLQVVAPTTSSLIDAYVVPQVFSMRLSLLAKQMHWCQERAVQIPGGGSLGVCDRRDRGDLIYVIVFDSSDELANPDYRYSEAWKAAAIALHREAPFGIVTFTTEVREGHFYKLIFDVNRDAANFE
jgi:hypothetical protein